MSAIGLRRAPSSLPRHRRRLPSFGDCSDSGVDFKVHPNCFSSTSSLPSLPRQNPLASKAANSSIAPRRNQRRASKPRSSESLTRSHGSERQGSYTPAGNSGSSVGAPGAVLFLDVDGVLHGAHCKFPRQQFNADCLASLRDVVRITGAEIVLSTAWRLDPDARQILGTKLEEHGLPDFVGRTADIDMFHRSREILAWVRKYRPISWVAIDDWPLAQETDELSGHFVQARPRYGLQADTAARIVSLFQAQGVDVSCGL